MGQHTKGRGRFVKQKLLLSSSFGRDLFYMFLRYDFGHTRLCSLSRPWMFNKPTLGSWAISLAYWYLEETT